MDSDLIGVGEIVDVEDIEGIRVLIGANNWPMIEYMVKWKVSPACASLQLTAFECRSLDRMKRNVVELLLPA